MSILANAMKAVHNTKQKNGESLQHYAGKFKTAKAILELHLGSCMIFQKTIKALKNYNVLDIAATEQLVMMINILLKSNTLNR